MPRKSNPKRSFAPLPTAPKRCGWARVAVYRGHPHHKRSPGDFGLIPPAQPHAKKTLCDAAGVTEKAVAGALLASGLCRGMTSPLMTERGLPKYVWAIDESGQVFELQGDHQGVYHGYPLLEDDAFREVVVNEWPVRKQCERKGCPACSPGEGAR